MNSKEYFFDKVIEESLPIETEARKIKVLELGCGTASYVPTLINKYHEIEYFGVEPIKESFDKALTNLDGVPRTKIVYQLGYDQIEELEDFSFDVVISFSVLEHVKDLPRFLNLAARYLKPGGLMVHRYDLGHALYPGSLKERLHVFLGNHIPLLLSEINFVRYVPQAEVESEYKRLGFVIEKKTFHQMPNHKRLEKELDKNSLEIMEDLYAWEFDNAHAFSAIPVEKCEKLFPTVAIWGRKNA